MKIKVITSYKPGTWNQYAKRAVDSVLKHWPANTDVSVYHESQTQDIFEHPRVQWLDAHKVQPAKGSFQWNAVRFSNKIFCVTHAIKSSIGHDYVIWLDADTYSFRPMPESFLEELLPQDSLITYLGRENPKLADGGKDPECGFVGYNLNHPEIKNFYNDWEDLYINAGIFKLTSGWTDCSSLWYLSKKYQKNKRVKVNDIGYASGVKLKINETRSLDTVRTA